MISRRVSFIFDNPEAEEILRTRDILHMCGGLPGNNIPVALREALRLYRQFRDGEFTCRPGSAPMCAKLMSLLV